MQLPLLARAGTIGLIVGPAGLADRVCLRLTRLLRHGDTCQLAEQGTQ